MTSFYAQEELLKIGFKSIGKDVLISRKACFYTPSSISIGDNVRIDDFCILSGNIVLGSHIHISAYVSIYGKYGVELEDYTGISPYSTIYSAMDDFSGNFLIGPIHNSNSTNVTGGKVLVRRFAQIGTHSVIFPNLKIDEGTVIGACSLLTKTTEAWSIYYGIPAKKMKDRKCNLLKYIN